MFEVTITAKRREAEGIYSFELSRADGAELPPFAAGAHIDVQVGDGLLRQYSLCNSPRERHRYLIAVLREPASRGGSRALHERIEVGQGLSIGAPRNLFALQPQARRHLLLAGGIGITPLLSMAHELAASGADFELHYRAKAPSHAAFLELLDSAPFSARTSRYFARADFDVARLIGPPQADNHLYVCGPESFMAHVLDSARALGWADAQLHREHFAAPLPAATANDGSFEVQIASSGAVYQIPADRSVHEVLEEAGIEIPVSCCHGICGACLTPVLEGIPDHRDLVLSEEEQAENTLFTPCCSRARSPRLVLGL
ncbi:PDR/VanB family oxidoreductase [Pseudomonas lopnurensis]|uniref:PDR/VanB family oxidoreductase n=1 Tax=Pseudomonas lopnurensis TaxID=1477517 RepID=UPI00187AE723|nr:PDR/VanB family oxidoreductase [Pseudomonas lopnurensis]MBE7374369.1 oxidoreductase [Pseudomonas lopnurensis]